MNQGMTLLDPWMLLCILPVCWYAWRAGPRLPAVRFAAATQARMTRPTWRTRLHSVPIALQLAGIVAACIALARPVHQVELPHRATGIDILLCIDVSSSMAESSGSSTLPDAPTRLQAVSSAAIEFVGARKSDRFGVVRFAEYADLVCPLTLDHVAVAETLQALRPLDPANPEDRTGIGTACARAAQVLQAGSDAKSKVVILFTDGLENVATPQNPAEIGPLEAAEVCRALGLRVYVITTTAGASLAQANRQHEVARLRALADLTGGTFEPLTTATTEDSPPDFSGVFERIDALERSEFEQPRFEITDAFEVLVAIAVALLVVGRTLAVTVWRAVP